jgi:uncharacterized membrane protein YqaE (UPF0057 family)
MQQNAYRIAIQRVLLGVIFPPAAVWHHGTNVVIFVAFFTALGWIPGVMVAEGILLDEALKKRQERIRMETLMSNTRTLVQLPEDYQSGDERLEIAQRGQEMVEAQKQKQERKH